MSSSSSELPKSWNALYLAGRAVLWSVFISGMIAFAMSILFPSSVFSFNFEKSSKSGINAFMNPRTPNGDTRENGRFDEGETLLIDASAFGDFSRISARVESASGSTNLEGTVLSVRRSQKVFFYPEGPVASFPSGSLLRCGENWYRIAPDGTRKRFPNEASVRTLGLDPKSFLSVSPEELSVNRDGGMLNISESPLPNGSTIRIDDTYYEWLDGKFVPFVSQESFLARFPKEWAIPKDASFLHGYELSENWLGYPSGSLLAWGDGVFLMDKESPRPILGSDIFLSLGYDWSDVRPASDEEISLSQKGKAVNFGTPQPDGTLLLDTKEHRYFLIENEKKREITGENLLRFLLGNRHPVLVSSDSLERTSSCVLKKISWASSSSFSCTVSVGSIANFSGDTYEFSLPVAAKTHIRYISASLEKSFSQKTLLETLSVLKRRIFSRFVPTATP